MIDLSHKELLPKVEKTIAILESEGHEVIVVKETYTETKCFIDGWYYGISHYVEDPEGYAHGCIADYLKLSQTMVDNGFSKGPDLYQPKYKRYLNALGK